MRKLEADEVTTCTGLIYEPWALGQMVGYRIWHSSGAVQYIYFNPTTHSDDDMDNVFVYLGSAGDPNEDEPLCHFDIEHLTVETVNNNKED